MKKQYDIDKIMQENEVLINKSKEYMSKITDDFEHNQEHIKDVIGFLIQIMNNINEEFNPTVCIIAAYWHDVARTVMGDGHEQESSEMLKHEMQQLGYNSDLILQCYQAVLYHKWNMQPKTIEGKIVRDADKLAWIGTLRWKECLNNNQSLEAIVELLPKLRNEILHFDISREIYDNQIPQLINLIYSKVIDKSN